MDLAQLQSFVAVAEAGGFSRAAPLIGATQPTLSRQVQALERELGKALFDRLGRRVELTAFGRDALARARTILGEVEALALSGGQKSGRASGILRLGVADSVVLKRLPQILQSFQEHHPAVRVHVRTASSPDILSWVREGRCDAGLCMLPGAHPDLVLRELWVDRLVGIAPPEHPFAREEGEIALAEFAAERQIVIQPGTLTHQVLIAAYHEAELSLVPDMTIGNFQTIVELVAAGVGLGIVSRDVAEAAIADGSVRALCVRGLDALRRSLGIALHAERGTDGALGAFVQALDDPAAAFAQQRP